MLKIRSLLWKKIIKGWTDCCFYPRRPQIFYLPNLTNTVHLSLSDGEVEYLKVQHDFNQLAAIGRWQATPLMQDCLQLRTRQFIKVQFHKPIPEGSRKHLGNAENMIKRALASNFQNGGSATHYKKKNPSKEVKNSLTKKTYTMWWQQE